VQSVHAERHGDVVVDRIDEPVLKDGDRQANAATDAGRGKEAVPTDGDVRLDLGAVDRVIARAGDRVVGARA
jgi:hypothetical protein